MDNANLPGKG
jgi:hypothetical protein